MKTIKKSPSLINVLGDFGNKPNYKARISRNFKAWMDFRNESLSSNRKHVTITEYCNLLLSTSLKPLADLLIDYSGSRMFITHLKHSITEKIRHESHASNVKEQLTAALLEKYNKFRVSGAIRNSDKNIISKYK